MKPSNLIFTLGLVALTAFSGCETSASPAPSEPPSPPSATPTAAPIPQRQETALIGPHEEQAVATFANKLFVIGGYDSNNSTTAEVLVFDGSKWTVGPPLPNPTDHVAAAVAQDHLYVVGGNQPSGTTASVYQLNDAGSGWNKVGELLQPRAALALVTLGGKLFVLGGFGTSGNNLPAVETYNPSNNTSQVTSTFPFPRNHLAGFSYQGMVCAVGGRSGGVTYARVDCYNPTLGNWQQLADLPSATAGESAASTPGGAVVLGGENAVETQMVTQLFRLTAGSWTSEPMLDPRHGAGAAVLAGRVWIPGGALVPGRAPTTSCTSVPL